MGNELPNDHRLLDAVLRNDFLSFVMKVFAELRPGKRFEPSWHHQALAYYATLSAGTGEVQRLIVNLPPRSLKSMMLSVALPAYLLGRDPSRRIIVVSYNLDLAISFSRETRQIMRTAWYKRLFPSTEIVGQGTKEQFFTTGGGFRVALSTGGNFTGRGGDLIIIDDPMKATDAQSETQRNSLLTWATETLFSRLDDKLDGVIMLVAQRLHEDDLCGHMLRTGRWSHLNLPAIAENDEYITLGRVPPARHLRRVGDLLDARREPQHILDGLKREMGLSAFMAQYQQSPVPPDGDVIKTGWFRTYREVPDEGQRILSIDTAMKAGERNDWSVAMLWRVIDNRYFLENVWRRRAEFPELVHLVKALARDTRPDKILIEDKGSGTGLIQTLSDAPEGFSVIPYDPGSVDKETRMRIQSAKIEGGTVFLPPEAPWLEAFLEEVRRFPNGAYDDQIDAMSQLLEYASRRPAALWVGSYTR